MYTELWEVRSRGSLIIHLRRHHYQHYPFCSHSRVFGATPI